MAAALTSTERICQQLTSIENRLTPVESLMKALEKPASAAGISPVELIAKMTDGGKKNIGSDGAPGSFSEYNAKHGFKRLGAGAGEWLEAMYYADDISCRQKSYKTLDKMGVQKINQTKNAITKTALAESQGVTGGYTVPPMFSETLMTIAAEEAIIEPLCTKMPMTSLTLQVPSLDLTTVQGAGKTPFYGGIVGTWNAEAAGINESEPKFRQTELTAHQLSLYLIASNTLLADNAVGLESIITMLMSGAMRWYKEYAFLQGNGVGMPLGVLNCPATIQSTRTGGNNTVTYTSLAAMYAKIWFPDQKNSNSLVWMANQSTLPQILAVSDMSGGTGSATNSGRFAFVSFDQGAVKTPTWSLFGHPLYFTEKLPALGTAGDVMLIDWSRYLVGTRMDIQIEVSPHVKFLNNQMVWRIILRTDGQPWLNDKITLADGVTTVSPFVALAA